MRNDHLDTQNHFMSPAYPLQVLSYSFILIALPPTHGLTRSDGEVHALLATRTGVR